MSRSRPSSSRATAARSSCCTTPGPTCTANRPRTRNHLGFTHLCVRVDDVESVATRLVEHGGTVLESTRYSLPMGEGRSNDFVFVADPDGVRVELMKL